MYQLKREFMQVTFNRRAAMLLLAAIDRFRRDRRGAVTLVFGVSAIMLLMIVGFAVDFGRYYVEQNRVQRALDAAGLAVGASSVGYTAGENSCDSSTSDYLPTIADKFFNANYTTGVGKATAVVSGSTSAPVNVCQSSNGNTLVLSSIVAVPTTFMQLFGFTQLSSQVITKVVRAAGGLQLAMVLDNTGSMGLTTSDGVVALTAMK